MDMSHLISISVIAMCFLAGKSVGETNQEETDSISFLNKVEQELNMDLENATKELINQAELMIEATDSFVRAKTQQNLYKALEIISSDEAGYSSGSFRQYDEEDEYDEYEAPEGPTTTQRALIPQLLHILKAVVGTRNTTVRYVQSASKLLPEPVTKQIVGIVDLLYPEEAPKEIASPVQPASPRPLTNSKGAIAKKSKLSAVRSRGEKVSTILEEGIERHRKELEENVPDMFEGTKAAYDVYDSIVSLLESFRNTYQ